VPKAGSTCGIMRVTAKSNANSSFIITILRDKKAPLDPGTTE
jgi:hypothetical protein